MRTSRDVDEERFAELYRSHVSAVANYAARRTDHPSAVDVTAETFAIAWRRFDEIPPEPQTLPWLSGVARRVLANQNRGMARRSALHDRLRVGWTDAVWQPPEPADLRPLRVALETLSDNDRDLIHLAGAEGLSSAEIAAVLDISVEVARNRLSRARKRLREALAEANDNPNVEVAQYDR